jgi:hypothetical protein
MMSELRPKLAELFAYMDSTRAALIATAGGVNSSFAQMRPHDGTWSAREVLAHLAIVENGVVARMNASIAKAREAGIGPDLSGASFMNTLDRFAVAEPLTKWTAPARTISENAGTIDESLASLASSRERLKQTLIDSSDIDLHSMKSTHPALGDLDIYQWALFVAQHEERHRKQVERTLAEVTELAAECAPIV